MGGQPMWATPESLISTLVLEIPELRPMLDGHLRDNDGELLPHVFFGDVTRWAEGTGRAPNGNLADKVEASVGSSRRRLSRWG